MKQDYEYSYRTIANTREYKKAVGNRIKVMRRLRGMNDDQLAEASDIDNDFIRKIERGDRSMSLSTVISLAKALDMSIDTMIDLETPFEVINDKDIAESVMKYTYTGGFGESTVLRGGGYGYGGSLEGQKLINEIDELLNKLSLEELRAFRAYADVYVGSLNKNADSTDDVL